MSVFSIIMVALVLIIVSQTVVIFIILCQQKSYIQASQAYQLEAVEKIGMQARKALGIRATELSEMEERLEVRFKELNKITSSTTIAMSDILTALALAEKQ